MRVQVVEEVLVGINFRGPYFMEKKAIFLYLMLVLIFLYLAETWANNIASILIPENVQVEFFSEEDFEGI